MNIYEKLLAIQQGLVAPKDQHNDFGNYNYRSAESILASLKPLLAEQKCILLLSDDVEDGFIKATATIIDAETKNTEPLSGECGTSHVSVTAYAKHPDQKKGMDASQVTGATSSYARKYALNGLFSIDDTKDADALPPDTEKPKVVPKTAPKKRSKELQRVYDKTQLLASITGEKPGQIAAKLESYVGHPINEDLTAAHYARINIWFREQGVDDE